MLRALLLTISLTAVLAGCQQKPKAKALKPMVVAPPPPVIEERHEPLKFEQPQAMHPIKEGRPPLVYMLEAPAQVQVVDALDGTVLAAATLSARSIISVDSARGVRAGSEQLAPGPIPGQRVYQIFVTTGRTNEYRTGLMKPGEEQ